MKREQIEELSQKETRVAGQLFIHQIELFSHCALGRLVFISPVSVTQ